MIDFYDGVVVATVRLSWLPGLFVMSLVSWDFATRRRVFALIPVADSDASRLSSMLNAREPVESEIAEIGARLEGDISLILWNEHPPAVLDDARVSVDMVRDELFGDIQESLRPERQRWFTWGGWNH